MGLWLAGAIGLIAANPGAIRLDMFVGYDGAIPFGSWFPAAFEIQNQGPGFQGFLEVRSGPLATGSRRGFALELPAGTTKRFVLPLYNPGNAWGSWQAILRDERGRVRAETKDVTARRWQDRQVPLAGALSRVLPSLPDLPGRGGEQAPVFARLQPATFPDHPITLEGLATIYLASERAMELRPAQVTALISWLQAGGHLVVSLEQPGHLAGSAEWLRRLLPAEVTGLTQARVGGLLQDWVAGPVRRDGTRLPGAARPVPPRQAAFDSASFQVASLRVRDGRVLAGTDENPLIVMGRRGLGQVTLLAFVPELEPCRGWAQAPLLWAKLTDLGPELLAGKGRASDYVARSLDGVWGGMVDSRQVRKLPVGWLLLLLVAYLAVIGPIDQYCLRRARRQMLTWITFPLYVAFFSLLIYYIGYKLRAGETEWNELQVVDLVPRGAQAEWRGWTFAALYSPVNGRYRVASPQAVATLRAEGSGREAGPSRFQMVNQGCEADLSVPIWTSQLFISDWRREAPAPISLTVTGDQVIVLNRLAEPLSGARLCRGDTLYTLGVVPSGQSRAFTLSSLPQRGLRDYVQSYGDRFRSLADARQRAFGGNAEDQGMEVASAAMAACFPSLLARDADETWQQFRAPPGFDLKRLLAREDAVLLAFVPGHSPVPSLRQFPAPRGHQDTLYRLAVPVSSTP